MNIEKLMEEGACTAERAEKMIAAMNDIHSVISSLDMNNREMLANSHPALFQVAEDFGKTVEGLWSDSQVAITPARKGPMVRLTPVCMFSTPKNLDGLLDGLEQYSGGEKLAAMNGAMQAWNLCSKLTNPEHFDECLN